MVKIMSERKKMILVFAGPNGSDKSTVTSMISPVGEYINADEIKRATGLDDLASAQLAEKKRNDCLNNNKDFTFETVLSTPRNLELLKKAKENGFFIKSYFVLTASPQINVARVKSRFANGGHDVPKDKIIKRYHRALDILPELIKVSDICNVIDNTQKPFRIFSKKHGANRLWENDSWKQDDIIKLTKQTDFIEKHPFQPTDEQKATSNLGNSKKPDLYYIEKPTPEQLKSLEKSGIAYKLNPQKTIAAIAKVDKEKALECISKDTRGQFRK